MCADAVVVRVEAMTLAMCWRVRRRGRGVDAMPVRSRGPGHHGVKVNTTNKSIERVAITST